MSVTGKPDELDRELSEQLGAFGGSVIKTGSNLDELRTQHAAAVKALEAENKKKLNEKRKANGSKATSTTETKAADFKDGKPLFGSKPTAMSGESRSLFASDEGEKEAATDEATRPQPPILGMTGTSLLYCQINERPDLAIQFPEPVVIPVVDAPGAGGLPKWPPARTSAGRDWRNWLREFQQSAVDSFLPLTIKRRPPKTKPFPQVLSARCGAAYRGHPLRPDRSLTLIAHTGRGILHGECGCGGSRLIWR